MEIEKKISRRWERDREFYQSRDIEMTLPILNVLRIVKSSLPLFDQLCLEEALLRADQRNWLVISNIDNDVMVNDAKVNPQERSSSFSPSSPSSSKS